MYYRPNSVLIGDQIILPLTLIKTKLIPNFVITSSGDRDKTFFVTHSLVCAPSVQLYTGVFHSPSLKPAFRARRQTCLFSQLLHLVAAS